jgi:hypothetical protein
MKPARFSRLVIRAVAVTFPVMAIAGWVSPAHAQIRIGDDGHALDANNRIGSGGYNNTKDVDQRSAAITNNQIIYGNTTGLSYFHGQIQTFDPNEIQINTGSEASDRLNAIAGPVNYKARVTGSPQQNTLTPFYSTSNAALPPSREGQFQTTPGGAGLIPAPAIGPTPMNDTRLGIINSAATDQSFLPAAGELDLPGPVDTSGNQSVITASPLYGVKAWSATDSSDTFFLSKYSNLRPEAPGDGMRLDNAAIQQMRNELNTTVVNPNGQSNALPVQNLANSAQIVGTAAQQQPINDAVNNQPLNANANANQGVQQQLLIPPAEQSTQLAELQRRLAKSKATMTNAQANDAYNQVLAQKNADEEKARKLAAADAQNPAGITGKPSEAPGNPMDLKSLPQGNPSTPTETPALKPVVQGPLTNTPEQPYVITSLATGIKSPSLAKLLKTAEDQMRQGKFTGALNTYDDAQQVVPNNAFVTLGRSFAELGASYYGKSELDLRRSVTTEPAVLIGQYDLKGFLGEDRLQFVQKDLTDIYNHEKSQRPALLLAYIAHNTGDDTAAGTYLNAAQQRAGGPDPLINAMRDAWGLPVSK